MNGYICQGFNPLQAFPEQGQDPRGAGQAEIPRRDGSAGHGDLAFLGELRPAESVRSCKDPDRGLPAADHVLRRGERLAGQFRALAAMALEGRRCRRARPAATSAIMSGIFHRLREMYRKEGGAFPDPILNLTWNYTDPADPTPEELAKEMNGRALVDIKDANGAVVLQGRTAARRLRAAARRRHHRRPAAGSIPACFTEKGNMMARRDATDPREQGIAPNWAWAWPANRRILYNRASADLGRQALESEQADDRMERQPMGRASTCPTIVPTTKPSDGVGPFIMNAEGVGRLFARDQMARRAVPRALRADGTPVGKRAASEGRHQSRRPRLRRRPRGIRDGRRLPLCGHDLSPDRALPLLDQARSDQRHPAARGVRRDRRGAGQGERHRSGRTGCRSPPNAASWSARPTSPSASSR